MVMLSLGVTVYYLVVVPGSIINLCRGLRSLLKSLFLYLQPLIMVILIHSIILPRESNIFIFSVFIVTKILEPIRNSVMYDVSMIVLITISPIFT